MAGVWRGASWVSIFLAYILRIWPASHPSHAGAAGHNIWDIAVIFVTHIEEVLGNVSCENLRRTLIYESWVGREIQPFSVPYMAGFGF